MEYYVYENWQAHGHQARIHAGTCSYCNNGKGIHRDASEKHGRWLGPFSSVQTAMDAAYKTGSRVALCKMCAPK